MQKVASIMPLIQRDRFRWREPRAFVLARRARQRAKIPWWHRPLAALVYASFLPIGFGIIHLGRVDRPYPIPEAIGGGLALAIISYFLLWFGDKISASFGPPYIGISEKGISRVPGRPRWIGHADIQFYTWEIQQGTTTLVVTLHKYGPKFIYGVPPEVSRKAVDAFLLGCGVQQRAVSH